MLLGHAAVQSVKQYSAALVAELCCHGRRESRPLLPFHLMRGREEIHRGILFEGQSCSFSGWVQGEADCP